MITLKEFFAKPYRVYIWCKTDEEAKILFKEFDKINKRWCDGKPYRPNDSIHRQQFGKNTCYSNNGYYWHIQGIRYKPGQMPKIVYKFKEVVFKKENIILGEKITLKTFFNSNIELGIHCRKRKQAIKLCKEFKKLGKVWIDGSSYYLHNHWWIHKENTIYFNDYLMDDLNRIKKANLNIRIYEFEDIIFEKEGE